MCIESKHFISESGNHNIPLVHYLELNCYIKARIIKHNYRYIIFYYITRNTLTRDLLSELYDSVDSI